MTTTYPILKVLTYYLPSTVLYYYLVLLCTYYAAAAYYLHRLHRKFLPCKMFHAKCYHAKCCHAKCCTFLEHNILHGGDCIEIFAMQNVMSPRKVLTSCVKDRERSLSHIRSWSDVMLHSQFGLDSERPN